MSVKHGDVAVFGGGCFWCLEAAFEIVPGVLDVESGYAGGESENPSYEMVSSGLSGHAEVVRIRYDTGMVGYEKLLELFFKIHDPTTRNRQGADMGTQYRSVILYGNEGEKEIASRFIASLAGRHKNPVVTELLPLGKFWPAEEYHQDYFRKNPEYGYCQMVVVPKVEKAKVFVSAIKAL